MILGRGTDCVLIPLRQVSRQHAKLTPSPDGAVEDLGSKNGTYVNGHLVKSPVTLRDGDELKISLAQILPTSAPMPPCPWKSYPLNCNACGLTWLPGVWVLEEGIGPTLSALVQLAQVLYEQTGEVVSR